VEDYKREAAKVIREIRARGNLPILVGGTQYYVDPLLFTDVILDQVQQTDSSKSFPILDEPTEVLLQELRKCDPVMAERWHPNDRRKIMRSLEIYLHTGKPASQFYAEQEARKAAVVNGETPTNLWEKLLFWVYSDRQVLTDRLDARCDKMLNAGLLDEVHQLYDYKKQVENNGQQTDMTKGIWQSIGYKQFEPYLRGIDEGKDAKEIEKLKLAGLEDMKAATRRYANYQTKWIRIKQMRRLQDEGPQAVSSLYLVDSTDVSQFQANVVEPAAKVTELFLQGKQRPAAEEMSQTAREVLSGAAELRPKEVLIQRTCEMCQTVLVTEEAWQRHIKGVGHKRVAKRKAKLMHAAVRAETQGREDEEKDKSDESRASSPDIGSIFSN
jgi:tRNA dimethylallyltransferase